MKKIILLVFLLIISITGYAVDFSIESEDGTIFYFNYINNGEELQVALVRSPSQNVVIPETVTHMNVEKKVTSIRTNAFQNCTNIITLTIPSSVTIESKAFSGCSNMTTVIFGCESAGIGSGAFEGCTSLKKVVVKDANAWLHFYFYDHVANPLYYAHYLYDEDDNEITTINVPEGINSISQYAFYNCYSLKRINLPNTIKKIGQYSFCCCLGLESVTLPTSVTTIEKFAFSSCNSLTSLVIDSNVSYIGKNAFDCEQLATVVSLIQEPYDIDTNVFSKNSYYNGTLYVPEGKTKSYQNKTGWKLFNNIAEGLPIEEPEHPKCATPTISYDDKKLIFNCETEDVEFVSEIKDVDIKKYHESEISLLATYEISVYAVKSGYDNSEVATATLVWTDAIFTETTPSSETPTSAKSFAESIPVLISAQGGSINVKCEQDGQTVTVSTVDGKVIGNATVSNGLATISTPIQSKDVVVVKVGNKSIKLLMR